MRKELITIAIILAIAGFLFLKAGDVGETPGFGASLPNFEEESERWSSLIKKVGAREAFKIFASAYSDEHFYLQHLVAHLFGELTFMEEGFSGWTGCGGDFFYGCYHGFFAKAVGRRGEEPISELDEVCRGVAGKSKDDCYHGIGHGLVEYLGSQNLDEALQTCSIIEDGINCVRGALMEYNTPFVVEGGALLMKSRSFDPKRPHEPCDGISSEFKTICYYELGWRWGSDLGSDYEKIGKLCSEVEQESYRKSCFEGIGRMAVLTTNHNPRDAVSRCSRVGDKEENRSCLSGALRSFQNSSVHHEKSEEIVKVLEKL